MIFFADFSRINVLGGIYLFKVNNRNTRTTCEIYSKLSIKIHHNGFLDGILVSGVFIANFEQISHIVLVFALLTLNK